MNLAQGCSLSRNPLLPGRDRCSVAPGSIAGRSGTSHQPIAYDGEGTNGARPGLPPPSDTQESHARRHERCCCTAVASASLCGDASRASRSARRRATPSAPPAAAAAAARDARQQLCISVPGKGLLSRFCATIREIRDFNREIYGTNREGVCINQTLGAEVVALDAQLLCGGLPVEAALQSVNLQGAEAAALGQVLEGHDFHTALDLRLLAGGPEADELMEQLKAASPPVGLSARAKLRLLIGDAHHVARISAAAKLRPELSFSQAGKAGNDRKGNDPITQSSGELEGGQASALSREPSALPDPARRPRLQEHDDDGGVS
eukprot:SAG31_NODE_6876_length_1863_cov_1.358844_1_plen_319_part_10